MEEIKSKSEEVAESGISSLGSVIRSGNDLKRKTTTGIKNNMNLLSMVAIFIISFLIALAEYNFSADIALKDVALNTLINTLLLWLCSYIIFLLADKSGISDGKKTKEYIAAKEKFQKAHDEFIHSEYSERLNEYCEYYVAEELKFSRINILTGTGIKYKTFEEKYLNLSKEEISSLPLSDYHKKTLIKAISLKPVSLSADSLLKMDKTSSNDRTPLPVSAFEKQKKAKKKRAFSTILTTMCICFVAFKDISLTFNGIITGIIKMLPIIFNAFMGYQEGYSAMLEDEIAYLDTKADILTKALSYLKNKDFTPLNDGV